MFPYHCQFSIQYNSRFLSCFFFCWLSLKQKLRTSVPEAILTDATTRSKVYSLQVAKEKINAIQKITQTSNPLQKFTQLYMSGNSNSCLEKRYSARQYRNTKHISTQAKQASNLTHSRSCAYVSSVSLQLESKIVYIYLLDFN